MTLYTDRKPREAVARAICFERQGRQWDCVHGCSPDTSGCLGPIDSELRQARAALNTLRELGFITSEGLDAIHAEEDANGEPRSSVVPGSGR